MDKNKKRDNKGYYFLKENLFKPGKVVFEILLIQGAITLLFGFIALIFYNYERISILSLLPGLIGVYLTGKKYKKWINEKNNPYFRLEITTYFILLSFIIYFLLIDQIVNPASFFLIIILEIIHGFLIYWILSNIREIR